MLEAISHCFRIAEMNQEEKNVLLKELMQEKESNFESQKQIEEDKKVIKQLQENQDKLQKSLEETQKILLMTQKKLSEEKKLNEKRKTQEQGTDHTIEHEKLKHQLQDVLQHNQSLQKQLKEANETTELLSKQLEEEKFNAELAYKTTEQLQLRHLSGDTSNSPSTEEAHSEIINQLQIEKHDLEKQLKESLASMGELQHQLATATEQMHNQSAVISDLPQDKSAVNQLEVKLKRTEKQLETLKQVIAEDAKKHQSSAFDMKNTVATLTTQNLLLQQQLKTKENELENLTETQLRQFEIKNRDLSRLIEEEQLRSMELLNDMHHLASDKDNIISKLHTELQQCISNHQQELDSVHTSQIAPLTLQLAQLQQSSSKEISHLQILLSQETKEKAELAQQLNNMQAFSDATVATWQSALTQCENLLAASRGELELNIAEKHNYQHKWEESKLKCEQQNQLQQKIQDQLQKVTQQLQENQQQVLEGQTHFITVTNTLKEEIHALKAELSLCEAMHQNLLNEKQDILQSKLNVEQELYQEREDKKQLVQSVKGEAGTIQQLSSQIEHFTSQKKLDEIAKDKLQESITQLQQQLNTEVATSSHLKEQLQFMQSQIQELLAKTQGLDSELLQSKQHVITLEQQVANAEHTKLKHEQEMKVEQNLRLSMETEQLTLHSHITQLGEQLKSDKLLIDQLHKELEQQQYSVSKNQDSDVQTQLQDTLVEVRVLQTQLQEEKIQHQKLFEQLRDECTTRKYLQDQTEKLAKICEESQNTLEFAQQHHTEEKHKLLAELDALKKQLYQERADHTAMLKQLQTEKLNMDLSGIEALKEQISELKKVYETQTMFDTPDEISK